MRLWQEAGATPGDGASTGGRPLQEQAQSAAGSCGSRWEQVGQQHPPPHSWSTGHHHVPERQAGSLHLGPRRRPLLTSCSTLRPGAPALQRHGSHIHNPSSGTSQASPGDPGGRKSAAQRGSPPASVRKAPPCERADISKHRRSGSILAQPRAPLTARHGPARAEPLSGRPAACARVRRSDGDGNGSSCPAGQDADTSADSRAPRRLPTCDKERTSQTPCRADEMHARNRRPRPLPQLAHRSLLYADAETSLRRVEPPGSRQKCRRKCLWSSSSFWYLNQTSETH